MKNKHSLRALLTSTICSAIFVAGAAAVEAEPLAPSMRIFAGLAGARLTPLAANPRRETFQDRIHLLGLSLNLSGGTAAYSAPVIPRPSDEEPDSGTSPSAPPPARAVRKREVDAKMKIHYQAQATLLIRPGSSYFDRRVYEDTNSFASSHTQGNPREPRGADFFLLPGRNLLVGLDPKYCGDCSLLMGYATGGGMSAKSKSPRHNEGRTANAGPRHALMGGRTGALGLHAVFNHHAYGELRVIPYFAPEPSDRAASGNPIPPDSAFFHGSGLARGPEEEKHQTGAGSRIEYRLNLAMLELGLFYSRRRIVGGRGILRTEYTGFGLGARLPAGFSTYLSLERMGGSLIEKRIADPSFKSAPPQPAGGALRLSGDFRRGAFHMEWNLFLPQGATRKPGERETTGYILAGANPLDAMLLGGALNAGPAPRARHVMSSAPETNTEQLLGLEHAGLLNLDARWSAGLYEFSLGLDYLQPLRESAGGGPFKLRKKDGEAYLEVSLGLAARLGSSRARLAWSRLYFRGVEGKRMLGESLHFILEYAL